MDIAVLQKLKVLYVEDEIELRNTTFNSFSVFVNDVVVASNGKEGLALFTSEEFDVVITDLSMPVMTGIEMIEEIRKLNNSIPIIVTTAFGSQNEEVIELTKIGMTTYLMKPVDVRELITTIYEVVT
ncbi:MAG: response regulator [Campylobacterota bacterium]|nr:response regulator [Campylobacterota bacterium]